MDKWMRDLYGIPDPPPLWVPEYQPPQFVSEPGQGGSSATQAINRQRLVTKATALYLASPYEAKVVEKPWEGAGGPDSASALEYILHWPDGVEVNAGDL